MNFQPFFLIYPDTAKPFSTFLIVITMLLHLSYTCKIDISTFSYFPYLLRRLWNVLIALIRSIFRNSGQNTSIKTNSLYALCHNKKPLSLFSPEVLSIRSGSGCGKCEV